MLGIQFSSVFKVTGCVWVMVRATQTLSIREHSREVGCSLCCLVDLDYSISVDYQEPMLKEVVASGFACWHYYVWIGPLERGALSPRFDMRGH